MCVLFYKIIIIFYNIQSTKADVDLCFVSYTVQASYDVYQGISLPSRLLFKLDIVESLNCREL